MNGINSSRFTCTCYSRIERLWRDVYVQVLDTFHVVFNNVEREGLLNPDDERDLFALHWAFLPQLKKQLAFFMDAWNNHPMRTTGSQSPFQLWTSARHHEDPDEVSIISPRHISSHIIQ